MSDEFEDDSATEDPAAWWDEAYEGDVYDDGVPWDTGEPQSAFVRLADAGQIEGRVLDVGCGTGTEAIYLAEQGYEVVGVDFSAEAIGRANEKATSRERDLDVTFRVGDVLDLRDEAGSFDTVVDSGLFHALQDDQRERYADELARVLRSGGSAFVLSFGEDAPEGGGPRPVSESDVRAAFGGEEWAIREIRETTFEAVEAVPGCLAIVERKTE
ncbi:class I SAM-dependent methyltransferase [Halorussus halophilus]|uniref:class I SAM-dependent methyltransferase n=1 Tax=Halorussus halophilus TaxID=2650975 RepID=UPI0013017ADE|nr:class I SAM-dependent methyltransferase [Halorussus halophilus]